MKFKPHDYQRAGVEFLIENPFSFLFFDPGLGKTVTSLTAFRALKRLGLVSRALVFAPIHVLNDAWEYEPKTWGHLRNLSFENIQGDNATNRTLRFLDSAADIVGINPENAAWLVDTNLRDRIAAQGFDVLIVDEISKFKSPAAKCFKALRKVIGGFKYRWGLTGSPIPHSYIDLWSQFFLIDGGQRLGPTNTAFKRRYCHQGGFKNREWFLNDSAPEQIETAISDIVIRADAETYLDLPELKICDRWVTMPKTAVKAYRKLEREFIAELEDGRTIESDSAAGKYMTCRQLANGGYYDRDGNAQFYHDTKVDAVESIREELGGRPMIVAYQFNHDLERLKKRFIHNTRDYFATINGDSRPADVKRRVAKWNANEYQILFVQPSAMSHGLNMQKGDGRDFVFFGLPESLEVYEQAFKRVYRQGVTSGVRVHRILTRGTVDRAMMKRTDNKSLRQRNFLEAMK